MAVEPLPIERLKPGSELHKKVLGELTRRISAAERRMMAFHDRWTLNERAVQGYINHKKTEAELKRFNDRGDPPVPISVTVPFAFASVHTAVTYLLHAFAGRKPIIQLDAYKKDWVDNARTMEKVLQYNADHTRLVRALYRWFWDACVYGVGVLRIGWVNEYAQRTVPLAAPELAVFGGPKAVKVRERRLVYSGNEVSVIDPFLFYPDPRVPMHEVPSKGEFVFWRSFVMYHELKRKEQAGVYRWVDAAPKVRESVSPMSDRALVSGGEGIAGLVREDALDFPYQEDQGTVEIIPADWGLGDSKYPEKWLFTVLNKAQIVQAEPWDADHGKHPVAVIEPLSMGQSFGSISPVDVLKPFQDLQSWLVNSHMENVRVALNNIWIVDPSSVEMQDLKDPGPGKIVRLKASAFGRDVKGVISQLPVMDVTGGHLRDMDVIVRLGHMMMGLNDNLLGLHHSGGRKTATEVRTAGEAGVSRLAAMARVVSAQGMVELVNQMVVNIQQWLDPGFGLELMGDDGQLIVASPERLAGDFHYPIHDGTLPLDRVALLEVWQSIVLGIAKDPELRRVFNLPKIVEYVAELGGAKNISAFKLAIDVQQEG